MASARPDSASRTREGLERLFEWFGEVDAPQIDGTLYREMCRGIVGDADLLDMASRAPATQPPPNLLFAAVH